MSIAKEGLREIALATLVLGALGAGAAWWYAPAVIPFALLWLWTIAFFRDPIRCGHFSPGDLCSPADGTITEVSELDGYYGIDGPALRIGMFLSLFNVHINRMPCTGRVRSVTHRPGKFLDARHRDSGRLNESNTLVIDPDAPQGGPVVVRQVAGLLARRIICHASEGEHWPIGARFGLIKFGSRTELIVPRQPGTDVRVAIGDKVLAGTTVLIRQPIEMHDAVACSERGALPTTAEEKSTVPVGAPPARRCE